MKQKLLNKFWLRVWMLVAVMTTALAGTAWADGTTGTITFGKNDVAINSANVTANDDQSNSWTITTSETTSFTANAAYYQVGSSNKPATSITFTTTLPDAVNVTAVEAKFGGFSGTAGTVTLKVGETTVGTGSLNATNDVTVSSTSAEVGNTITVTITNIAKGVKAYYISYTYEAVAPKTDPTITFNNGSVRVGQNLDLSTLFTSNSEGAVTYSITAGDSYASLNGSTLTGTAVGDVTVKATQAEASNYNASEATATITVNAALALSSIAITTAPTKTIYTEGETFDPAGMVVTATYSDSSTGDVTASCTFSPSTALTTSDTEITVSYTENAVEKTTTQTITVNALPKYTVTFGDGGSVTQASYGAEVTLPSRDAISSYTFAGWSETNVAEETTTAPTIIPAGSYTPTANITLYPVYSKTEAGGGTVNKTASVNIGTYASANGWSNGTKYTSVTLDGNVTATVSKGGGNTGKYYSSGDGSWRFYANESGVLTISTTNGELTSITITYTGNTLTNNENNVTSGTAVSVSGTSASFSVSGSSSNSQVTAISVDYTISGGGTTYYWSAPVAATVERPTITPKDNPFTFSTDVEITCETDDATIYYTLDGTDPTDASTPYSEAFEITSACTIKAIAIKGSDESSIATLEVTKNLAENTITVIGGTSQTIDLGQGEDQLEITATATNDATVTFTIDNENTTLTEDDDFLLEGNIIEIYSDNLGVIVLKANAAGDDDYAAATEVTITITVDNSMLPGRAGNPYTVAQARAAIDAGTGITDVYATGIVSQAGTVNGSGQISYYISADGLTTSDQLQAYKGKGIAGANFENDDDIQVGDVVIIYGNLKKYNTTYEFDQNNQLVSLVRKIDSDLAISSDATVNLTITSAEMHPTSTITYTTSSTGDVIFVSNEEDVAQVSDAGVITALGEGSTTITVMQEADATYKAGEQTITINVTDNRSAVATDINLPAAQKTLTVGDMDDFAPTATIDAGFTGSVTYTYATSDASVVAVAGTTFSAEAAGTATITITATPTGGNAANYKTATQEVEVTVKGATTLALSGNTATPTYPATATITATVGEGYDGTLTVSSNNEAVVTASVVGTTITITPVAVGTATITVTAPETSIFNGEVERTIEVTVNAPAGTNVAPASSEVTYTFDFTDNTDWEFPTDYTTGENTYTKDGKTITLNTPDNSNGYKFNTNVLLIGKSGATLTLPAFDKPVTKITTTGVSSASGKVTQNIYVGETAVSTETTSAKDNHEYIIVPKYQAPGTIYTFKVTNGNNSQLSDLTVHMNQTITVTLNASGYATFCSQYPLDFSAAEGYTAWQITDIEGETITFSKITGDIKGGQGILLKGEANATVTLTSANSETEMAENLLFGTTAPTYVAADTYYGLSGKTFKKVNAGTVPAGKALLPASVVDGSSAKEFLTFVFEDDATGIENVNDNVNDNNAVIYNLAGQRISKMQKGINIVNGKKILK